MKLFLVSLIVRLVGVDGEIAKLSSNYEKLVNDLIGVVDSDIDTLLWNFEDDFFVHECRMKACKLLPRRQCKFNLE